MERGGAVHYVYGLAAWVAAVLIMSGSRILHGSFFSGEKFRADYLADVSVFLSRLFFPIFLSFLAAADLQVSEVTMRCSLSI